MPKEDFAIPPKPKGEKKFRVFINHEVCHVPLQEGKPTPGWKYKRGGYSIDANEGIVVSESELDSFKINVPITRSNKEKRIVDPKLIVKEIIE